LHLSPRQAYDFPVACKSTQHNRIGPTPERILASDYGGSGLLIWSAMIPTPKYSIGQTVFSASIRKVREDLPCPDCLGSREWTARSPAGTEIKTACPRCSVRFGSTDSELSLERWVYTPLVSRLTVGSVRIDTNDLKHPVEYMCVETGVGSGQVHHEERLFADQAGATEYATFLANDGNAAQPKRADQILQDRCIPLDIPSASRLVFKNGVYASWARYRFLSDDVRELMEESGLPEEIKGKLDSMLEWDNTRAGYENLFDDLVKAAAVAAEKHQDEALLAALAKLPFKASDCAVVVA
jgi:hypothetical protein